MIRVLIADDHALIREGLRKVFNRESDISVVGEAADSGAAMEFVRSHPVDVAILDINMPGRNGLEALAQIRRERPRLPVLILSMLPEERFAVRVLKAGAAGFVSKDSIAEQIVDAVRTVAGGGRYVSAQTATQLAISVGRPSQIEPHEALSRRELQVFLLIADGRGTREIAEALSLSVNTVATYRRRILAKLNLRTEAEIVRYAIEHRLSG